MPSAWEALQLGPFFGGINTLSDPSGIEDNELVDCVNLELDLNGSLIVRPPIQTIVGPIAGSRIRMLGQARINNLYYLILANNTTVWAFDGAAFTELVTGIYASKAVQYKSNIYIIAFDSSLVTGGFWNGAAYTNIASMPKGSDAIIYKERMWIPSGTTSGRLFFSNIADPGVWSSSDFFDISPGDGQSLWRLAIFNNNLLIFKSDSTFVLSYDTKPPDATLEKVSNTIGVTANCCFAQNQNSIFVYHEGYVYQLVNFEFVQVNQRVVFEHDGFSPTPREDNICLSFVGNRLIVRFFNRIYVYNILTQTWTRWEANDSAINNFSRFMEFPSDPTVSVDKIFYAGSSLSTSSDIFIIRDAHTSIQNEAALITCKIKTKDYTFEAPWKFKRLFAWGADILTLRDVTSIATPITFGFTPTWENVAAFKWDELNTWEKPLSESLQIITSVTGGPGTLKRFYKFNKSVRFRQINFEVTMETDGTLGEGPNRFYTLTLFMRVKQTVSKQVS